MFEIKKVGFSEPAFFISSSRGAGWSFSSGASWSFSRGATLSRTPTTKRSAVKLSCR